MIQVGDEQFALDAAGRNEVGDLRIELKGLDGAAVDFIVGERSFRGVFEDLSGIVETKRAIIKCASNDALLSVVGCCPC
jgi:hypothetical protein